MTQREREAVEQALEYLNQHPPRTGLARGCLKAALDPEAVRWGDDDPDVSSAPTNKACSW